MERITPEIAKNIMGENFIGVEELKILINRVSPIGIDVEQLPKLEYDSETLECYSNDYILILGLSHIGTVPLSIKTLRDCFGMNPDVSEPCFYNQDWYLNERFINDTLEKKWYLIKKEVIEETRAVMPIDLMSHINFPSATLCAYTFFANYFANGSILWEHDFVWCSDVDHNGDRIYVGKYNDIDAINKNGFSIHRHLALRNCYGALNVL